MAKVKCGFCGELIDKKTAVCRPRGKTNRYYCNETHASSKKPRDIFYEAVYGVLGTITNTVLFKEFDALGNVHGFEKMIEYLKDNEPYLNNVMSKNFSSTYAKVRYFSAIFKNNLDDFTVKAPEIKKEVQIEMYESKYKPKKQNKGLDSLLEDLLGE